jgi:hypothetical protein
MQRAEGESIHREFPETRGEGIFDLLYDVQNRDKVFDKKVTGSLFLR